MCGGWGSPVGSGAGGFLEFQLRMGVVTVENQVRDVENGLIILMT